MDDQELLDRIEQDPDVLAGKPVIEGTRLSVEFILNLLAQGTSQEEILEEYTGLERDDIRACLIFAQKTVGETSFVPRSRGSV